MSHEEAQNEAFDRDTTFDQEDRHLRDVVELIGSDIRDKENRASRPTYGPDVRSADAVVAHAEEDIERLKAARPNPFFGRVDFSEEGSEDIQTMYIGTSGVNIPDVPEGFILNHNAPIAALYYNPAAGMYSTPRDGAKRATVFLKRSLSIEDAQLRDIDDVLRLAYPGGQEVLSSRMLDERLSGPSARYMTDAVQTL